MPAVCWDYSVCLSARQPGFGYHVQLSLSEALSKLPSQTEPVSSLVGWDPVAPAHSIAVGPGGI